MSERPKRRTVRPELTEREAACIGPRDLKRLGTVEWAWQTLSALKRHWEMRRLSILEFDQIVAELTEHRAWELVPPGKPYGTLDAMLRAEIGHTEDGVRVSLAQKMAADPEVQPLAEHGGAREQGSNTTLASRGADYLVRRLKRDAPKIAERLAKGEYPSARAAAIEAGIVKVPTALDTLKKAWAKVPEDDRQEFMFWVAETDYLTWVAGCPLLGLMANWELANPDERKELLAWMESEGVQ